MIVKMNKYKILRIQLNFLVKIIHNIKFFKVPMLSGLTEKFSKGDFKYLGPEHLFNKD